MTPTPKHKTAHSETSARTIVLSRRTALGLRGGAGAAVALEPLLDRSVVLAADNVKKGGQVVVALSQEPTER